MTTPLNQYISGLYSVLVADSDVQAALTTYDGRAAVFTGTEAPEDASYPYCRIYRPSSDSYNNEFSNKQTNPTAPNSKIHIWDLKRETTKPLNKAADAVYNALHDQPKKLSNEMNDMTCLMLKCSGPVLGTEGDGTVSNVINVSSNLSTF